MSNDPEPNDRPAARTVFLRYSRRDQPCAQQLAEALGQAGLTVWWDALIEGGASFAKSIEAALQASDAVVVLWSAASVASDWVLDEAAHGRDLHKLVPVSIDGTLPPLGFRQYQAIVLPAPGERADPAAVAAVVRAVQALANGGRAAARTSAQAPAPANQSRRGLLIGGAATALLVAGGGVLGWRRGWFTPAAPVSGSSVAVLPFKNISGDATRAYFSDGLSEEVRATLARNLRLQVMAQSSSGQFRASEEGAVSIAGKLGVTFLLDGSVRWAGDIVRVAADLVDGRTGFSRWSQVFERRIDDVFAVQREIAGAVANALAAQVYVGVASCIDTSGSIAMPNFRGCGGSDVSIQDATPSTLSTLATPLRMCQYMTRPSLPKTRPSLPQWLRHVGNQDEPRFVEAVWECCTRRPISWSCLACVPAARWRGAISRSPGTPSTAAAGVQTLPRSACPA